MSPISFFSNSPSCDGAPTATVSRGDPCLDWLSLFHLKVEPHPLLPPFLRQRPLQNRVSYPARVPVTIDPLHLLRANFPVMEERPPPKRQRVAKNDPLHLLKANFPATEERLHPKRQRIAKEAMPPNQLPFSLDDPQLSEHCPKVLEMDLFRCQDGPQWRAFLEQHAPSCSLLRWSARFVEAHSLNLDKMASALYDMKKVLLLISVERVRQRNGSYPFSPYLVGHARRFKDGEDARIREEYADLVAQLYACHPALSHLPQREGFDLIRISSMGRVSYRSYDSILNEQLMRWRCNNATLNLIPKFDTTGWGLPLFELVEGLTALVHRLHPDGRCACQDCALANHLDLRYVHYHSLIKLLAIEWQSVYVHDEAKLMQWLNDIALPSLKSLYIQLHPVSIGVLTLLLGRIQKARQAVALTGMASAEELA